MIVSKICDARGRTQAGHVCHLCLLASLCPCTFPTNVSHAVYAFVCIRFCFSRLHGEREPFTDAAAAPGNKSV